MDRSCKIKELRIKHTESQRRDKQVGLLFSFLCFLPPVHLQYPKLTQKNACLAQENMPRDFISKQIFIQCFRKSVSSNPFPSKCRQKFIWCQLVFLTAFLTAWVGALPVPDFRTIWTFTMGPFFHSSFVLFSLFCHCRKTFTLTAERDNKSNVDTDLLAAQSNLLPIQKEKIPGSNLGCAWFKAVFSVHPLEHGRLECTGWFARLQEAHIKSYQTHHEISHSHTFRKSFFPASML